MRLANFVGWTLLLLLLAVPSLLAAQAPGDNTGETQKELESSGRLVIKNHVKVPYDINNRPSEPVYPVPLPPFSSDLIFPCSQCHAHLKTNPKRRVLKEYHTNIVLHHGENRWCFDCHNPDNRDKLRLISGKLIDFSVSYRLCGQCHGAKYRDWKAGVHGKRTGYWNGEKEYLLCVHCHNPHDPKFKPLKPMPPPVRPEDIGR